MPLAVMITVVATALTTRLSLIWKSRHRGCDAYYFLLCAEEYRRHRKLPIALPNYYLLDKPEQWYPPGFAVFLSWIPDKWLKRNYWLINPLLDSLIAVLLSWFLWAETGSWVAATVGGMAYALAWPAITDCQNLNSRPLGDLLFTVMMLGLIQWLNNGWSGWFVLAVAACYLTFMTHKLTMQLVYLLLPFMAIVTGDVKPVIVLGTALVGAFGLNHRVAIDILRGQANILKFWRRNWRNLGAHQVLSSPVYGDEGRQDPGRVFQTGVRGVVKNIAHMGANPFILVALAALAALVAISTAPLSNTEQVIAAWMLFTYALAWATMMTPELRFYGEGYKYLRLAVFPVAFLVGTVVAKTGQDGGGIAIFWGGYPWGWYLAIAGCGIVALLVILTRVRDVSRLAVNPVVDADLEKALEYLRRPEVTAVMTIPTHLMDTIVYHCRKPVVWGTHSAGFENVEPLFPVFREKVEWFVEKYAVSHIVVDERYVGNKVLKLGAPVFRSGRYSLFEAQALRF